VGNIRRPKRGSLAFHPRARASRHAGRVRCWPASEKLGLLGFPAYKAGMTHVHMIEDRPNSPEKGKEVLRAATVVDCPPVKVFGVRAYSTNKFGKFVISEVWHDQIDKDLARRVKRLPKQMDFEKRIAEMEALLDSASDVTVLVHTLPRLTGLKKKPDIIEIGLGGPSAKEKFAYAKGLLGKEIRVSDVFRSGELVDVTAVTKGKGFQGPVKRFGIRIRNRKTNDARRNPGSLGPWHPHQIMWSVPLAGQTGYHQRTEFNKRLLRIGNSESPINPKGGFLRYGQVDNEYALLAGSTPGPTKRLINLRKPVRPWKHLPDGIPDLTAVSVASCQGK